jgi:hypothetical protein
LHGSIMYFDSVRIGMLVQKTNGQSNGLPGACCMPLTESGRRDGGRTRSGGV